MEFHGISYKIALKTLKSRVSGLTNSEVLARQKTYGANILAFEKPKKWHWYFFKQFASPLIFLLLAALALTAIIGDLADSLIIGTALILETIFGFFQEFRANKTLAALKKVVPFETKVKRNNQVMAIPAEKVAAGDILVLGAGDKVPADARIINSYALEVNEAILTGEVFPINKSEKVISQKTILAERQNIIYAGTTILAGKVEAVVFGIGENTEFGKTAKLVKTRETKTPLQEKIGNFSAVLTVVIVGLVLIAFVVGLFIGMPFDKILVMSVALAVAAVPEGLIVVLTIILAIGMQRILKQGSIVKNLLAAETLGSVNVICADKTGTLTTGELKLVGLKKPAGDILKVSIIASDAVIENPSAPLAKWKILGDPLEGAIYRAAFEEGFSPLTIKNKFHSVAEIPFDPEIKFSAVLDSSGILNVKGSPEKILGLCKLSFKQKEELHLSFEREAEKGLRVLAIASRRLGKKKEINESDVAHLKFLGFLFFEDPLREGAREVLEQAKLAGITTVIITGDHPYTARRVARSLGLDISAGHLATGYELDKIREKGLFKIIRDIKVFARATPLHKLWITRAWKKAGATVAMTGDGVNDAPALSEAHIGVALGSGTEVAKEASDLVLLDNNFKTILAAVEQGRIIFDNIRKVLTYLLAHAFTEIILVLGSLILLLPLPLSASQILWIKLMADGLPDAALALEPGERDVMLRKPIPRKQGLLNGEMITLIFIVGIATDLLLLLVFYFMIKNGDPVAHAQTFMYAALGLDSVIHVFSIKSLRKTIFQINIFSNKWLNWSILFGVAMIFLALYFPPLQSFFGLGALDLQDWLVLIGISILQLILIELTKWIFIVRKKV